MRSARFRFYAAAIAQYGGRDSRVDGPGDAEVFYGNN